MTYGEIWGFETDRYFTENDFVTDADGNRKYAQGIADQSGLQVNAPNGNLFVFGPGDIKYKDLDGNGVIDGGEGTADNHGDLKVIGNATPRYEYSFRLGGAWKGFDIDMFFQGVGKRDMWTTSNFVIPFSNNDNAVYANQEDYNKIIYNDAKEVIGYQISEGNFYPALSSGANQGGTIKGIDNGANNFYPQSKYLMNMAYLRFKNLTVGYTLPLSLPKKHLYRKPASTSRPTTSASSTTVCANTPSTPK